MNGIAVVDPSDCNGEAGTGNKDRRNGSTSNGSGAIKDNGTSVARAPPPPYPSIIASDKGRYGNGEGENKDSNIKDSNTNPSIILTKGESGSRLNEAIRDDDCMGDKTGKGKVLSTSSSSTSFQQNGNSKTFPTLSTAKSDDDALALVGKGSPSLASPSSRTKRLTGNVNHVVDEHGDADDDYRESSKREESNNGGTGGQSKENYSRQFFAAFAANFGAVALGTVLAWTSPALPDLRERKTMGEISIEEETWISAIALLGAASACPIVGYGIERFGRRRCLLLLTLPFLLGWMLITLAQNIWMIYVGRFLSGFAAGGGSIAIPVYVTESASANIRGMLASGFDMMITVGILYAFVVGTFVSWEWQAVACGLIPIAFHILMLFVPESPMYLVKQGLRTDASNALQWLRGAESSQQVEIELEELISSVSSSQDKSATWRDLLDLAALKPILLAVSLMVFQQLAPTDAIMFFTVDIFESSGVDVNENLSANIVGTIQVMAVIVAALFVDRAGRRFLLLLSEFFMVISLGTMGAFFYMKEANHGVVPTGMGWLPLASLMVYVVAFSIGMGPLCWLLMGELLPLHIKGKASGIVTITRWLLGFAGATLDFAITFLFKYLIEIIGHPYCYWVFSGCCLVGGIFVLIFVPETKGKSLDEIQEYFASRKPSIPPGQSNGNVQDQDQEENGKKN